MRCRSSRWHPGPSPLTRGKLQERHAHPLLVGLIPAHAGKTSSSSWLLRRSAAHPRSRGENSRVVMMVPFRGAHPRSRGENSGTSCCLQWCQGSSPLTRGKRICIDGDRAVLRLIPAHAGKTARTGHRTPTPRAYPRSRGENWKRDRLIYGRAGLSPLTRGKRGRSG